MADFWIKPAQLFDGQAIVDDIAVKVVDGLVTELGNAPGSARSIQGCLSPGYVDLQVNGGGVLLNNVPTVDGVTQIAAAHRKFGTVAIMPTVITDHPDVLGHAADAIIAAKGTDGIIGLHIEGPHISPAKRGTHQAAFIRPLDTQTISVVARLAAARIPCIITLAPEAASVEQIKELVALGAVVSVGHTDARADQVQTALEAGATCATHLFNAMSPMTSRAPGAVGAVLNSDCYAGIICDGHHVDDDVIQIALRARPNPDRLFLVSDAMATVGGPDHFQLYGDEIRVKNGRLINADGNLAGAHITMSQSVARLVNVIGVSPARALRMAVTIPAAAVGQPMLSQIIRRRVQDLILLGSDMTVQMTLDDAISA